MLCSSPVLKNVSALVTILIAVIKEGDSGGKGLFRFTVRGNTAHGEGKGMAAGM